MSTHNRHHRFNGVFSREARRSRLSSSMVEQWTFNPLVLGSSPRGGTEGSARQAALLRRDDDSHGISYVADCTIAVVPDGARRDLSLPGDQSGRPGSHEVADEVDVMARHTGAPGVADDVGQLDECAGRCHRWFVVEGSRLDGFLSSSAQPGATAERSEHRVGDDRCCGGAPSLADLEGREGHPECTDCFTDRIVVFAQSAVALRGRQHAGQQTLNNDTAGQLVVGRQREKRTEQPFAALAPSGMGPIDDLIKIVEIADQCGQVGGDSVGPRSRLAKCSRGTVETGPLAIELCRQAVVIGWSGGCGRCAAPGVVSSGVPIW